MPESADVDELKIKSEEDGACQQPNQHKRNGCAPKRDFEENDLHDHVRQWLHDGIDFFINGRGHRHKGLNYSSE